MVELVTIPGVPIIRTGTYQLSTGEHTFTEEDLRAAAHALATDPAIKAPRVKIASVEKALDLDPLEHGGEPAFGYVDALAVSENGQELLGDFHVPESVRDAMEWAYPALSIEGGPHVSATQRSHDLVVSAVALLGIHWPGVTTLDDFVEFLADGPKIEKTADAPHEVLATVPQRQREVAASLDQDLVGRRFYDGIEHGDIDLPDGVSSAYDLWVRSMRFDDTGKPYLKVTDEASGRLFRVDFKVKGSEVTFGAFSEVVEQDVPVTAGAARPLAPLAAWATRDESRAVLASQSNMEDSMTDEQRRALALSLGLPEDTAEARLHEVAAERSAAPPDPEAGDDPVVDDPQTTPVGDPSNPASITVPAGMALVDEATLADMREGVALARATAATTARAERDAVISAAVRDGRIPPSRREAYERMWGDPTAQDVTARRGDPEGTRALLAALTPGLVPVEQVEAGAAGDGESTEGQDAYDPAWLPEVTRRKQGLAAMAGEGVQTGARIVTEAM